MKPYDRSFYSHFAFVALCATAIVWMCLHSPAWIVLFAGYGAATGIVSGWIGHLGHDVGHAQAPKGNRQLRHAFQLIVGPVGLGFSALWWINKHVLHHNNPNVEGKDQDLNVPIPLTTGQAYKRGLTASSFRVKNARWIFPLLLPFQALVARISSIKYLFLLREKRGERILETGGIVIHICLYLLLLSLIGEKAGWACAIIFLLFHQGTHGFYNSLVFATNHKGMPVQTEGHTLDWATLQVITSRNVKVSLPGQKFERITDELITWLYGGLNYQIEHHLFPTMPRANLRKARPLVIRFCLENRIDYYETGIIRSYKEVLKNFETVRLSLLDSPMGA